MKKYRMLFLAVLLLYLASCEKTGVLGTEHIPYPTPDSSRDIRTVLAGSPFTLFEQAAARAGLDSLLPTGGFFTILAPVDSAMQSAGLSAAVISSLSVDSLQKIVLYHVAQGSYSPGSLTAAVSNIQAPSLRQDISYNNLTANVLIYQPPLFLKIAGALYVNGEVANHPSDTAFTASNGYIYPITTVLNAPEQTVWQVLEARPELSMYLASLRLDDSLYHVNGLLGGFGVLLGDSVLFNYVVYTNQTVAGNGNARAMTTVFAPTNAAFAAAGFHSPADLRTYAESAAAIGRDAQYVFNYTPLDSVLKQHLIGNSQYTFSNLSLYNDLLLNPNINNGGFNAFNPPVSGMVYTSVYSPQFFDKDNVVDIQWSGNPAQPPAVLPADKSGHFLAKNGVVYEIGQLFYPHN